MSKPNFTKRDHRSLAERIAEAESKDEIARLLSEGAGYADAALDTVQRWRRNAQKRGKELDGQCS